MFPPDHLLLRLRLAVARKKLACVVWPMERRRWTVQEVDAWTVALATRWAEVLKRTGRLTPTPTPKE